MKKYIAKATVVLGLVLGTAISAEPRENNNSLQIVVNNETLVFQHDQKLISGIVGMHIKTGSKTGNANNFTTTSSESRSNYRSLRAALADRDSYQDILSCVFYANTSFGIDALRGDLN